MNNASFDTIDAYIASTPKEHQALLQEIRRIILKAAPAGTSEIISYQMPTFRYHGNLIHFALFKNHVGIYPGTEAIEQFKEELKSFKTSKGAFQIPLNTAIPKDIIKDIVQFNAEQLKDKKGPTWHDYQNNWLEAEEFMQQLIIETPLEKTFKWGINVYTYNDKNVVAWVGFKHFFAIWFYNGIFLEDKENLLITSSEGKTKALRQWRFKNVQEMDEKKILAYILESIQTIKDGKEILIEKSAPKEIKGYLKEQLDANNAFEKLTPGRQKDYIEYIEDAKQEKTKVSRMDKIKPMIMAGKGLHDKYKNKG